jgi:hypothetical protein
MVSGRRSCPARPSALSLDADNRRDNRVLGDVPGEEPAMPAHDETISGDEHHRRSGGQLAEGIGSGGMHDPCGAVVERDSQRSRRHRQRQRSAADIGRPVCARGNYQQGHGPHRSSRPVRMRGGGQDFPRYLRDVGPEDGAVGGAAARDQPHGLQQGAKGVSTMSTGAMCVIVWRLVRMLRSPWRSESSARQVVDAPGHPAWSAGRVMPSVPSTS